MEESVTEAMVTTACPHCQNTIDVTGLEAGDGLTCPYCGAEFPLTKQFGNFILERQLGAGGMGAVYLGKDSTLDRQVAVKVLRPELVSDQKFMATFLRRLKSPPPSITPTSCRSTPLGSTRRSTTWWWSIFPAARSTTRS